MMNAVTSRNAAPSAQVVLASLALAIPVSLGFTDKPVAFLLAPFIAYAMWTARADMTTKVFVVAGLCGLISISVVNGMAPRNLRDNLSELVVWTMFTSSFLFLGRLLPLKESTFWLAILSAIFLIVVTIPLLVTGDPVRAIYLVETQGHGPGTSYLDVRFFGLPVFATFGVNSLAPLFCIQAAVISGAIYATSRPVRLFLAAGLACATLLIIESNSRTAQGTLGLLVFAVAVFAVRRRQKIAPALAIVSALLVGGAAVGLRGMDDGRLVASVSDILGTGHQARWAIKKKPTMETVTTGRTTLWRAAIRDVRHSPVFGNGFAGFGQFFPVTDAEGNTTAHCYYLTILWKGGIIFAVPFVAFIGLAFRRAWKRRNGSPEWYFSATAVALMFLLPSLSWDILMIPGAGALTWFLFGLIQVPSEVSKVYCEEPCQDSKIGLNSP